LFESLEQQKNIKQERWNQLSADIEKIRDGLGKEIDPGIKSTVVALNAMGFETTGSCEGHIGWGKGPYVDVGKYPDELSAKLRAFWEERKEPDEETEAKVTEVNLVLLREQIRLMGLLSQFYRGRDVPFERRLILTPFGDTYTSRLINQATEFQEGFVPEQKIENLRLFKKEMEDFSDFLRERFSSE
jgi:hypothetical protein